MIEVSYVDHMGSDLSVVNAARVSLAAQSDWDDTAELGLALTEGDERLIGYLAKHRHKSPFNHAFASFRIKAPIFVARQLVKHEYLPWNEVSRRYVEGDLEWYFPDLDDYRSQPANVKQGSGLPLTPDVAKLIAGRFVKVCDEAGQAYNYAISKGLSREQARMILPQNMMTEWVWSGSVYAFAKMCQLRLDAHAQAEARYVAQRVKANLDSMFPVSMAALEKHGAY